MSKLIAVEVFFRDRRLKEQVFDKDSISIGRDPASDVHLDNVGVSRLHATLRRGPGGVRIADAGSANGSLVNLMRVTDAQLAPTDQVQIGKFVLRVSERDRAAQVPERETIRLDGTSTVAAQQPSPVGAGSKAGSRLFVGAVLVAAVAIGCALALL